LEFDFSLKILLISNFISWLIIHSINIRRNINDSENISSCGFGFTYIWSELRGVS